MNTNEKILISVDLLKKITKTFSDMNKELEEKIKMKNTNEKDKIVIQESSGQFGKGFTIWINGRWVLDASCFTDDFKVTIDNHRMKKKLETKGKYGKVVYKWDKRFKK